MSSVPSDRPDLDALAAKWSAILEQQNSEKRLVYQRGFEIPGCRGKCSYHIQSDRALIKILEPEDADPTWPFGYDIEQTVVHEILHIPLEPFWPTEDEDDLRYKMAEQFVDKMARVLVKQQRRIEELEARESERLAPLVADIRRARKRQCKKR